MIENGLYKPFFFILFLVTISCAYNVLPTILFIKEQGIIQSMSRKGNCLDNSPMENFFGIMKREMFYGHEYEFKTLDELRIAMKEYIKYYNTQRITVKLRV